MHELLVCTPKKKGGKNAMVVLFSGSAPKQEPMDFYRGPND